MGQKKIGAIIALDGERDFRKSVSNCTKSLNQMKAEMELVKAENAGQEKSLDSLGKEHKALTKVLDAQKDKEEAVRKGLDHARSSYETMGKKIQDLKKNMEDATEELKKMETSTESSKEEVEQQRKKVEELSQALKKSEENYEKAGNRVTQWETDLTKAKTETAKATNAVKQNEEAMKQVSEATQEYADSLEEAGENAEKGAKESTGLSNVMSTLASKINPATISVAAIGTTFATTEKEAVDFSTQMQSTTAKLQANMGASNVQMTKYKETLTDLYNNNYGEGLEYIATSMEKVKQATGELDPTKLEELTENAITLEDVFDMDLNETIRGTNVLINKFGLTSKQSFDLMAKGAQNGLNKTDELGDNIAEYGPLWKQAGFSAEEMFTILQNGLDAGAYNLDKVNDFVKEFTISLSDGRIESSLNSFSDGTKDLFNKWKEGKATAKDVFFSVISDLKNCTNQQEALTLASNTWSALGEDNAMDIITSLGNVNEAYKDVGGTMEDIKKISYDTLESDLESLGRKVHTEILQPIGEQALPLLQKGAETAGDVIDTIGEKINRPESALKSFIDEIKESNDSVDSVIKNVRNSMSTAEDSAAKVEVYKQKLLELNEVGSKTEFQKYQIKKIVEDLADTVPELSAAWDEESGKINLTSDSIAELMDKQEAYLVQQAAMEAQKDSLEALFEAEMNAAKASNALEEAEGQLTEMEKMSVLSRSEGIIAAGKYNQELYKQQLTVHDAIKAEQKANEVRDEAQKSYDDTTKAIQDASEKLGAYGSAEDDATLTTQKMTEAVEQSTAIVSEQTVTIAEKYAEMRDSVTGSLQSQMDMFEEFNGGAEISSQKLLENMQSQIDGVTKWADNMESLAKRGVNDGLLEHLAELGPQGASYVQAFANMSDSELKKANSMWTKSLDMKSGVESSVDSMLKAYTTSIAGGKDKVKDAMSELGVNSWEGLKNAIAAKESEAKASGVELGEALISGSAEGLGVHSPSWKTAEQGRNTVQGLANGIKERQSTATTAAKTVADQVIKSMSINLDANKFMKQGQNVPKGIAQGMKQTMAQATGQANMLGQTIQKALATATVPERYQGYGKNVISGMNQGMRANSQYPVSTMSSILSNVKQRAGSVSLYSAGYNLPAGMARGINAGRSLVINAVASQCAAAVNTARSRLQIHSPSKVFEKLGGYTAEGFGNGYENKIKDINNMIADSMSFSGKHAKNVRMGGIAEPQKITLELPIYVGKTYTRTEIIEIAMDGITRKQNSVQRMKGVVASGF